MVSATQQFDRIRKRKKTNSGKRNKRTRRALGTPKFPVHVAGYDAKAADAKPATPAKAAKPVKAAAKPAAAKPAPATK